MESFADITASHLEQVGFRELLKHGSFQFDKVVAHHDGENRLIVRVEGDVESCGLKDDKERVKGGVEDGDDEVTACSDDVRSGEALLTVGCEEERVENVLSQTTEQSIRDL